MKQRKKSKQKNANLTTGYISQLWGKFHQITSTHFPVKSEQKHMKQTDTTLKRWKYLNCSKLCYSWVYQPALSKFSPNSVFCFLWKVNKETSESFTSKLIEIEIRLVLALLVYKTLSYTKIALIQAIYRQNFNVTYLLYRFV